VYRACIHCCQDLGRNELVEPFPIGRRLAFDAARGRLWVICPHCGRWNLTPLEERWEAVEECERRFRGIRLRAQTPNIGYARLREGLDLVRIGKPLRPEFAAWRYGREFTRRRTRYLLGAAAAGLAIGGVAAGGIYASAGLLLPHTAMFLYYFVRSQLGVARHVELPRGPGRAWTVESGNTMVLSDPEVGWRLSVRHHFGRTELKGDEARRWLSYLLARVNRDGGGDRLVASAVRQVEETTSEALIRRIATESDGWWSVDREYQREFEAKLNTPWNGNDQQPPKNRASLAEMSPSRRLALEMALHESTEQVAIDGELAALEAAWREAEEIAGIADELLLPSNVPAFIERNRPDERAR
jgi:hypothetical protein